MAFGAEIKKNSNGATANRETEDDKEGPQKRRKSVMPLVHKCNHLSFQDFIAQWQNHWGWPEAVAAELTFEAEACHIAYMYFQFSEKGIPLTPFTGAPTLNQGQSMWRAEKEKW